MSGTDRGISSKNSAPWDQGWMIDEITSGCNVLTEHLQGKSTCM
jgi:hypothetical protein